MREASPVQLQEVDTSQAASALNVQKGQFMLRWLNSLDDFNALNQAGGNVIQGAVALTKGWHEAIDDVFAEAYRDGRRMWGAGARPDLPLPDGILREIERQKRFAFRFAMDHARGFTDEPGRMNAAARSALYGNAIEGAFQRGAVDGAPPGQLIYWRANDGGDPCSVCPQYAANSPYTRETLPAFPRSGSTPCRARCRCFLEFRNAQGVRRVVDPPPSTPDAAEQSRSIRERVEGPRPNPPPGRRLPNLEEERLLQDLELRMNFAVRRADRADTAEETSRWLKIRRDLQERQIQLKNELGVWWVPSFSQKEVLTGVDIRAGDVSWLTYLRGIDGTTIHRAQAAAINEAAREAEADLQRLLKNLPTSGGPIVPSLDDLLRALGTSKEAAPPTFHPVGLQAFGEALQPLPGALDRVVVHLVGLGAEETLKAGIALVFACRQKAYPVDIGPLDSDWIATALLAGFFLEGPQDEIDALVAVVNERVGGRGVEVAPWQG